MEEKEKTELLKSYQEVVENIKPILDVQNELRLLCRFKTLFGYVETPAIYKVNKVWNDIDSDEEDDYGDDEDISDIDDDFESEDECITNDEPVETNEVDEVENPSDLQPPQPLEITIVDHDNESDVEKEQKTTNMEKMMKKLEILENQFAKIKAENETLKESIEQILESKTVF